MQPFDAFLYVFKTELLTVSIRIENFLVDVNTFVHQGHCADGWVSPNSNQATLRNCHDECATRSGVEYFAYNSNTCACYTKCPDDNNNNEYNAYRIIAQGTF